ncbi:MAG TPA: lysophospholipid acyltransferase family protein [Alphaproteobacteria bacterium]|nr:lysophospholipid acyltransferase family protein [Alphaproteobacteria bacterium]
MTHVLIGLALLFLFYPLRWLVRSISWERALRVGTLLGTLHARCWHDRLYRQVRDGMRTVWGDALTPADLERQVCRHFIIRYKHLIDGFFYHTLDATRTAHWVPAIDGRRHLDSAFACGRGAIILASHFGSFGMLLAALVFRGYRLYQVFTLTPSPHHRTWGRIERAIMRAKVRCWPRDRIGLAFWQPGTYLRPLYRRLCAGDVVVLYGDGARGQQFTRVPFLGHSLSLSVGPFKIAARARVPLIPAFIVRQADDRHRLILTPPIVLGDDTPASLQRGAEQYAAQLAAYIVAYPEHWFTWARLRRGQDIDGAVLEFARADVDRAQFYREARRQRV